MKKLSKREIHNYEKYQQLDKRYYGLLMKSNRTRIDVKRMNKVCNIDDHIIQVMNRPRKTVYFIPYKINCFDYMVNIFRSKIQNQKYIWENEILAVIKKIKTPKEVSEEAFGGFLVQSGILDYDEGQIYSRIEGIKREPHYQNVIYLLFIQFIHQFVSTIEAVTLKVISQNEYQSEEFSRRELDVYVQLKAKTTLSNLKYYDKYDRIYVIWNFLKHNSLDLYKKIQKYPEILLENHTFHHGDLAMDILNIDIDFMNSMFTDTMLFFENFCEKVFDEDIEISKWNYDEYFINLVRDEIEAINNPMGLPFF